MVRQLTQTYIVMNNCHANRTTVQVSQSELVLEVIVTLSV